MRRKVATLALVAASVNANAVIVLDAFQDANGVFHQTYCISSSANEPCSNNKQVVEVKPAKPVVQVEAPKQIHLKRTDNKPIRQLPANVDLKTNYRH